MSKQLILITAPFNCGHCARALKELPPICEEKGWEPFQLKILKSDITFYIDRNQDWVDSQLKLAMQKEKVDFLESIIKSLNGRGFNINAAINWEKFKVGI